MNQFCKAASFLLIMVLPFSFVNAQHSAKKKKQATTQKAKSAKKSKSTKSSPKTSQKSAQKKSTEPVAKKVQAAPIEISPDGNSPKVVTVTSAFKPSLRNAAKMNFSAATPLLDTTKIPITYNIPSQNLFFTYQPVAIKPVALGIDSGFKWVNNQYIKLGYGNYSTPYAEAGFAFGDGKKTIFDVTGKYVSSKGNLTYQEFSKINLQALGIFNSLKNELSTNFYYNNSNQYKYGYTAHTTFSKSQLQQNLNAFGAELGFKNKAATEFGVTYHPQIKLNYFADNNGASEYSFKGVAPVNKSITKALSIDLAFAADVTSFNKLAAPSKINNNLYYLKTALQFNTPNFKINAGILPSWDNKVFSMLPSVTAEAKLNQQNLVLMAGWVGSFNKNTYYSLSSVNPWMEQPNALLNTKQSEQYLGIKGSNGSHFTYNASISYFKVNNQPLFANDSATNNTQTFQLLYEPELKGVKFHAEAGYTIQEKLTFIGGLNYTQYTSQLAYYKPWGILPLELNGSLRYRVTKDLSVKSDIAFWDGSYYRTQNYDTQKLNAAVDLSAGAEFTVLPKLNLWIQFNNIFNNKYQRWNQYQVLGFNVLGGVVYSFQ